MYNLYVKTQINSPVLPAGATVELEGRTPQTNINYNTYLMLTPLFKSLIVSTNANGEYNLKVTDNKNGFYFKYHELDLFIKVPLTAIFNTNDKIKGILGIGFIPAGDCPSRKLGLCQLEDTADCYALTGEKQGTKKAFNYLMGMDSYKNGLLSSYYFNLFYQDKKTREIFKQYCIFYNVDTLRFNLKGDFRSTADIKCIEYLAEMGLNLTGYTARDDLKAELFDLINNNDNIILNGSNIMYNNVFNAVNSILELLTAEHPCRGGCLKNGCMNCYKLKGVNITVLLHGSQAGTKLNTAENRALLSHLFKIAGAEISPEYLAGGKDIIRRLQTCLINQGFFKRGEVPNHFLKVDKKGVLKFDGQSAILNYLFYIVKKYNIDLNALRGEL